MGAGARERGLPRVCPCTDISLSGPRPPRPQNESHPSAVSESFFQLTCFYDAIMMKFNLLQDPYQGSDDLWLESKLSLENQGYKKENTENSL